MTSDEINVCLQSVQEKGVILEILDQNDYVVDELSGILNSGNFSIDSESSIRRTCNLTFTLDKKTNINSSSPLWINKRFRLWITIVNILTGNIVKYNQGIYLINDPSISIMVSNENTVSITGLDKMAFLDDTLSGQFGLKTIINNQTPVSDAIKTTVELSGEKKLLIDTSPNVVPYKIEKEPTDSIYTILDEISKLYMQWKCFYDIDGNFVFRKTKNHLSDPIIFDFSLYSDSIIDINSNVKYSNVKNYFKVIGRLNSDKTQYSSELYIRDSNYPNNPFTIEKMGEKIPRKLVITEDNYYTQQQCDDRVKYEYDLHSNTADTITITTIPLLFLDVEMNVYIKYSNNKVNIDGVYNITNIDCGLKHNDTMVIQAYRLYM